MVNYGPLIFMGHPGPGKPPEVLVGQVLWHLSGRSPDPREENIRKKCTPAPDCRLLSMFLLYHVLKQLHMRN